MYKKKLAMDSSIDKLDVTQENENEVSVDSVDPLHVTFAEDPVTTDPVVKKTWARSIKTNNKKKRAALFNPSKKKPIGKTNGIVKVEANGEEEEERGAEVDEEDDVEYEVEGIVDEKKEGKITLYRVRWKGYKAKDDSWLPKQDLGCPMILKKYLRMKDKVKSDTFAVDAILDHRRCKGILYYLVHWVGFPDSDNSWQSKNNLNCPQLINEYHSKAEEEFVKSEQLKKAARQKAKDGNNEFEVEQIVGDKLMKGILSYKVRWLGWDAKDDTWVRESELQCPALIKAYETQKKKDETAKVKKRKLKKKHDDSDDSDDDYGKKKPKAQFYAVDRILNARINKQGTFDFFVCWKGYGFEDNSWIPEKDLDCSELVDEFFGKNKKKIPKSLQRKIEGIVEKPYVASTTQLVKFERKTQNSGGFRPGTLKARVAKNSA